MFLPISFLLPSHFISLLCFPPISLLLPSPFSSLLTSPFSSLFLPLSPGKLFHLHHPHPHPVSSIPGPQLHTPSYFSVVCPYTVPVWACPHPVDLLPVSAVQLCNNCLYSHLLYVLLWWIRLTYCGLNCVPHRREGEGTLPVGCVCVCARACVRACVCASMGVVV